MDDALSSALRFGSARASVDFFGCLDHDCDLNRERASVAIFWIF